MKEKSGRPGSPRALTQVPALVMESNTYLNAIETNQNMAALISNYQSLNSSDRQLVDQFVADLSLKASQCSGDFPEEIQ